MIRTKREYEAARCDLERNGEELRRLRAALEEAGLDEAGISRVAGQMVAMQAQTEAEIAAYECALAGDVGPVSLANLGQLLINERIARTLSQRELAERLGVDESVVSRDERNDYHGVTVTRATRVLAAMGADATVLPTARYERLEEAARAWEELQQRARRMTAEGLGIAGIETVGGAHVRGLVAALGATAWTDQVASWTQSQIIPHHPWPRYGGNEVLRSYGGKLTTSVGAAESTHGQAVDAPEFPGAMSVAGTGIPQRAWADMAGLVQMASASAATQVFQEVA